MNGTVIFGLFIIWTTLVVALGAFWGRAAGQAAMLKDFGMTWADYSARLNGRRPT